MGYKDNKARVWAAFSHAEDKTNVLKLCQSPELVWLICKEANFVQNNTPGKRGTEFPVISVAIL